MVVPKVVQAPFQTPLLRLLAADPGNKPYPRPPALPT